MSGAGKSMLDALQERAKELHCLYRVHEICGRVEAPLDEIFHEVVVDHPDRLGAPGGRVRAARGRDVRLRDPRSASRRPGSSRRRSASRARSSGNLEVYYRQAFPPADEGPFLKEERRLINTIAELLGQLLLHRQLVSSLRRVDGSGQSPSRRTRATGGSSSTSCARSTGPGYVKIARRMLNYLCWSGVEEAQRLLPRFTGSWSGPAGPEDPTDENRPMARRSLDALHEGRRGGLRDRLAAPRPRGDPSRASRSGSRTDRSGFLVEAVENQGTSLTDLAQALDALPARGAQRPASSRARSRSTCGSPSRAAS